jgi:hypothetical protein
MRRHIFWLHPWLWMLKEKCRHLYVNLEMAYYLLQIVPSYNEVAPHCGKSLSGVHSIILEMAL